jgi:ribose 5-phosphate isomerase B
VGKVFIGADHAGLPLKKALVEQLKKEFDLEDLGTYSEDSVHYPDFAKKVAERVANEKARGILVCGSGIGMSIAANKVPGIRAAMAWDVTSARLSRQHNDSNIVCMGARLIGPEVALEAARTWLTTEFQGGRHQVRIDLIGDMERTGISDGGGLPPFPPSEKKRS